MKVLAIGNSFSDDSMEYLFPILKELGATDILLGNLYIGGCSIDLHVQNAQNSSPDYEYRTNKNGEWHTVLNYKSVDALHSQDWEFISMQQASGYSGLSKTYDSLQKLKDFARKYAKKAKFFWNMTWAYQSDSQHPNFEYYGQNQKRMYNAILDVVQERILPDKDFVFIVPVGTAIQNARTVLGDTLTRDGFHLAIPVGRYIAALTWGRMLTKKSVEGICYAPEGIDESTKQIAIAAVENAVLHPFKITELL